MRIVFMGTPDFAVVSLRRLVEDGHDVVGVITQPDKLGNRKKLTMPAVKEYALTAGLPIFQPESMRGTEALELMRSLAPDLTVVAAYGQILPQDVLEVPKFGTINVHASVLPRYRGAAPINRVILDGGRETGVTIMHVAKRLDAGDIISVRKTPIGEDEDASELFARLAALGAELLSQTIPTIADGSAVRTPQNEAEATYAAMLSRDLSPIDWNMDAERIINQVRALVPWPWASFVYGDMTVQIWRALRSGAVSDPAGTLRVGKGGLVAACGDGKSIMITELQPQGGKRMAAGAWLNGMRLAAGSVLP